MFFQMFPLFRCSLFRFPLYFNFIKWQIPLPALNDSWLDDRQTDWSSNDARYLHICVDKRRRQRRHVDGVADGLVARAVDDVSQGLLRVLDGPALGVSVPEENQFLLRKYARLNKASFSCSNIGYKCSICANSWIPLAWPVLMGGVLVP